MNASVKTVTVGTAVAAPGTVVRGAIEVTRLGGGSMLEIPVVVINGAKPGKTFWVDGAIHGDEPEGPLCCQHLLQDVKPEELSGTLVLVPVINVPAFEAASRGNPLDTFSYDMNRIYPGRPNGYLSERVAAAHAKWMAQVADMEISIHSGGSHSYLHYAIFCDETPAAVEMAKAMGPKWGCIMSSPNPKGNPMAVLKEAGKVGLTVELGGRSATTPAGFAEVGRALADAALNIMRHYKMISGEASYPTNATKGSQEALLAPESGIFLAEPTIEFGAMMKKGDRIGRIVTIFGDELATISAPADGMIFGLRCLPNVTTGDWCCFYNKVEGPRP
jgi:predicted deacylase